MLYMGMGLRLYNILLILLLLQAYPSAAADALIGLNFKGSYALSFSGIPFGQMNVAIEQEPSYFRMQTDISSTGMADIFARHSSHTTASGKGKNFRYTQRSYQTRSQTRKKKRDIAMEYRGGRYVMEKVTPPDNRATRKEVPGKLKNDAYDPLSIIIEIRRRIIELRRGGDHVSGVDFPIKLYDGRRLTQAHVEVHDTRRISIGSETVPALHVTVRREPVAGFTDKELKQYRADEPALNIYFSDDERFLPLKLSIPFTFGSVSATLVE